MDFFNYDLIYVGMWNTHIGKSGNLKTLILSACVRNTDILNTTHHFKSKNEKITTLLNDPDCLPGQHSHTGANP